MVAVFSKACKFIKGITERPVHVIGVDDEGKNDVVNVNYRPSRVSEELIQQIYEQAKQANSYLM